MRIVALGLRCNNACVFCAQGELRLRADDRAADALERTLAEIAPGESVAFVGGEPTLDDRLPELVRAAQARGAASILVQTNARRLAYAAYVRALAEAASTLRLDVSLHGASAPMHDYHTEVEGSFAQTVAGIANARAAGIAVGITVVVTRSNFRHLGDIVRLAHTGRCDAIHLAPAAPFGSAARNRDRVVPADAMIAPHLARAVSEARRLGMHVWVEAPGAPAPPSEVAGRFAGMGAVEAILPEPSVQRLPIAGRPAPGRGEQRAQTRRTGTELKQILPALFPSEKPSATGSEG